MERIAPTLSRRSLGGILDETFVVYGKNFWRFIGLVAVVQVPVGLVSILLIYGLEGNIAVPIVSDLLDAFGTMFIYAAAVFAVGQQYAAGEISIRRCYVQAWWRAKSLVVLSVIVAATLSVILVPLAVTGQFWALALATLLAIPAVALAIYWSLGVQAIMVEGYKPVGALMRSFALVRGSWWRIFGITLVLGLVITGLAFALAIPFAVPSFITGVDQASVLSATFRELGGLVVEIAVLPVLFIAITLLYYDMRLRKEGDGLGSISREMGIAAV